MKTLYRICVVLSTVLVLGKSLPYQQQQPSYYHEQWRDQEHPRFYPPPVHEWPIRSYHQIPGHQILARPYPGTESTNFQQVPNYPVQAKSLSATGMVNTDQNYTSQNVNPHIIKKISIPLGGAGPRVIHLPTNGDPNNMKIIRVRTNYDGTYDDTDIPDPVKAVLARALAAQRGRKMHNNPANAHASVDSDNKYKPANNTRLKHRDSNPTKLNAPAHPFKRDYRPPKNFKSSTNAPVIKTSKTTVIITGNFGKASGSDNVKTVDENAKKVVNNVKTTAVTPKAYKSKSTPPYVATTQAPRRQKHKHRYVDAPVTPKTLKPTDNDNNSTAVTPADVTKSKPTLITSTTNKPAPTDQSTNNIPVTPRSVKTVQNYSSVDVLTDTTKTTPWHEDILPDSTPGPLEEYQLDIIKPIVPDNAPTNPISTKSDDSESRDSVRSDKRYDYDVNEDKYDSDDNDDKNAKDADVDKNLNFLIPSNVQPTLEPVPTSDDYDSQDITPPIHVIKHTPTTIGSDDDDEPVTPRQATSVSGDGYKNSSVPTYKPTSDPDYKITPKPVYKPTQDHVDKLKSTITEAYNKINEDTLVTPKPEKSLQTDDSNTPIADDLYPSYTQSDKNKDTKDDDEYSNDTNAGNETQSTTEDSRANTKLEVLLYGQKGLTDRTDSSDNFMDVTTHEKVTVSPDRDVTGNDLVGEDVNDHATKKDERTQDIADTEKNNDIIKNIDKKNTNGKDKTDDAHEIDDLHKNYKNADKVNHSLLNKDKAKSEKAQTENNQAGLSNKAVVNNDKTEKDVSKIKEVSTVIAKNEETNTSDKDKQSETIAKPNTVAQDKKTEMIGQYNTVDKDEKTQPMAKYKEDAEATVDKTNKQAAVDKDYLSTTNAPAENVETFEGSEGITVTSKDATKQVNQDLLNNITEQDKQAADDEDKTSSTKGNLLAENGETFKDSEGTTVTSQDANKQEKQNILNNITDQDKQATDDKDESSSTKGNALAENGETSEDSEETTVTSQDATKQEKQNILNNITDQDKQATDDKDKSSSTKVNAPVENVEKFEDSERTTVTSQNANKQAKQDILNNITEQDKKAADDKGKSSSTKGNAPAENVETFADSEETRVTSQDAIKQEKQDILNNITEQDKQTADDKDKTSSTKGNAPAENVETFADSEKTTVISQGATKQEKQDILNNIPEQDKQAADDKDKISLTEDNVSAENVEAFEGFEETTDDRSYRTSDDDLISKEEPLKLSNFVKYLIKNAFRGKTYLKKMFDEPNVKNFLKSIFHF